MPVAIAARLVPAVRVVFDSGIVMRHGKNVVVSQTFDDKSAMVQVIAIHNPAVAEKANGAITRHKKRPQIVIPKMVVGDKCKIVDPQTEIHVESQMAVVKQSKAGFEGGPGAAMAPTRNSRRLRARKPMPAPSHSRAPNSKRRCSATSGRNERQYRPRNNPIATTIRRQCNSNDPGQNTDARAGP